MIEEKSETESIHMVRFNITEYKFGIKHEKNVSAPAIVIETFDKNNKTI